MNIHDLKQRNPESYILFRTSNARRADTDGPCIRHIVEMVRGTWRVRHRALAAQLVQTPALAMPFITVDTREPSGIKVAAARTVLVYQLVVSKFGPVGCIERR